MTVRLLKIFLLALLAVGTNAFAAATQTRVDLLLDHEAAKPGQTIVAGVRLQMPEGWHTYWRNPGDSGKATEIKWDLPDGVTAGAIQWPVPEKFESEGFFTYIFRDTVVLRVPLTVAADAKPGTVEIHAKVDWLECQKTCIPGSANVAAKLSIGDDMRNSADAEIIDTWQKHLPATSHSVAVSADWEGETDNDERTLVLRVQPPAGVEIADYFPYFDKAVEIGAATKLESDGEGRVTIRKTVLRFGDSAWPKSLAGILVAATGASPPAYEFVAQIGAGSAIASTPTTTVASSTKAIVSAQPISFWKALLFAFIGGLILNIMPCVLPVIALKILGFVQQSKESPGRVRMLGIVYGVGVLCSFLVLAGLIIGVRLGGKAAGWGLQFQSPQFLVLMTILVTLVALNLFGVFEVNAGGGVMNAASQLSGREGASGAFFNGVLATILATPCTAPFLAPALGFALNESQPLWMVVVFFLTIGAGLAFPYVLLSFEPRWLKFLPKPGAWMERFKNAMGFPMLATAVWLFSLAAPRFGRGGYLWLGLFLVLLALSVWIWGEFVQRGRTRKGTAMVMALVILAGAYAFVLEAKLSWRAPEQIAEANSSDSELVIHGVHWKRWTPDIVAKLQAEGRPVLVNFTADWCLTCHAVVEPAIENPEVQTKLKEMNAVQVYADYTDTPEVLTRELQKFGRAGVPLVLVYPGTKDAEPMIIPDSVVTTVFRGGLMEALAKL
ncbi:DUF255 domain-containing protein [bacterium]|nr:DUF255 domain-containing protein [bacterium]